MTILTKILNFIIRLVTSLICRIDKSDFSKVPHQGPLVVALNHVSFLEAPLLFTHLQPRPLTALSKTENFENPLFGFILRQWNIIPIDRGKADFTALQETRKRLKNGEILAIFPEGTRSRNGILQQGKSGVVLVALRSNAPILPMAIYGSEKLGENLRRLRRTEFVVRVGEPFHINLNDERLNRENLEVITDEIMYQIAALLPEKYRGPYSDTEKVSYQYLEFAPEVAASAKNDTTSALQKD